MGEIIQLGVAIVILEDWDGESVLHGGSLVAHAFELLSELRTWATLTILSPQLKLIRELKATHCFTVC